MFPNNFPLYTCIFSILQCLTYDNSPPSQEKKNIIHSKEIQATSAVDQGQGKPRPTNCSFQEVCGRTVLNLNPRTWRRPKNTLSEKERPNHATQRHQW